ncbi:aldose 1-epimerase [Paenibacillus mucilaginosus]|uniref:Aldose 1-epimerase n=3 Tax=Paenibacillus mucilaginosus TaxID=61624 RepID=H6NJH4_9BACL|nr:aldose 1-epimerase [Paenibacillus mucilaginosus]AEI41082.1 Aldose 1-epimerase [Paenibacillus mucilaginosus KNP414]AFC29654.1 Aldose 1-epimerase [Paenibacillus mucilaginosus 3016]AFH61829.1 aldose epimerase [Paenibacillus mucilaginosus K02]MCG7211478.1 aldose 1-epimerase [Paenibacillus mucilaginosus]WDM30147.1 aldose 1-epimerase [Paenibacillus mucilaginosus]
MTTQPKAYQGDYQGEPAVWLQAGPYEAAVLPGVGANLIALRETVKGYKILREPEAGEMEAFKANPGVHGIPVLFPPNRYVDGKFPWNGRTYEFPVNEPATGNHLHGFLHTIPWTVEKFGSDETESWVVLSQKVSEGHSVHRYLPHDFTIRLRYTLGESGLLQHVSVHNDGEELLPCLLAFHTAINAPFAPGSTPEDVTFLATIGERWELNERMLPTGRFQELTPEEEQLKKGGVSPYFAEMDNHYTAVPQNGRNRMELRDHKEGVTLVYDVGTSYKQWMIWNNGASRKFFCPEPQVNLVNAPSVDLPAEEIGLFALEPGAVWEETSRLYLIRK